MKKLFLPDTFALSTVWSETELGLLCLSTAKSAYKLGNGTAGRHAIDRGIAACDRASEVIDVITGLAEFERESLVARISSVRETLRRLVPPVGVDGRIRDMRRHEQQGL